MDAFLIQGQQSPLRGSLAISGSKNATLPILTACLLSTEKHHLSHVPQLADVRTLNRLLQHMGAAITPLGPNQLLVETQGVQNFSAPYDLVRTMRASILVLGPLLARYQQAKVSLPGGCAIGDRPIDQHLKGLIALGADIQLEHGYVIAKAPKGLHGATIVFDMPTVTGTENLILAASLAKGTTVLKNAAREPEISDLSKALRSMGAQITGDGSDEITIIGQKSLGGMHHQVIADRIECGTLLVAGALLGDGLELTDCLIEHQSALIEKLRAIGCRIEEKNSALFIHKASQPQAVDIITSPFPGFPTDMQAQIMTLLSISQGSSQISETIFENRFMHVAELNRLGAHIKVEGRQALVQGVKTLSGTNVMATDLRASACLVLAGLIAEGQTKVRRIYHLDRGYEQLEKKLASVGANIQRIQEEDPAGYEHVPS